MWAEEEVQSVRSKNHARLEVYLLGEEALGADPHF